MTQLWGHRRMRGSHSLWDQGTGTACPHSDNGFRRKFYFLDCVKWVSMSEEFSYGINLPWVSWRRKTPELAVGRPHQRQLKRVKDMKTVGSVKALYFWTCDKATYLSDARESKRTDAYFQSRSMQLQLVKTSTHDTIGLCQQVRILATLFDVGEGL